ncbi:hypothetical protein [Clostridium felsineum]|uniref:Uncharacterized protein n=1 Tax=Clostridium felsineum TaxID=36839 RepID=A0A1S8L3H0_9CLOT|nr:hypothetical protein [Clostridium felsineum]URZ02720.1 hypothetical protein CLAUR_027440 [Clostridium felsineum]URZ08960.1 hypothetical protein CLROS_043640 [Clostridium felsineum]URZ09588.1 hypothetical protein CROST_002690 [Clostridium felsineum]
MGYIVMIFIAIALIAALKWKAAIVIGVFIVICYFLGKKDNKNNDGLIDKKDVEEEKPEKIMIPQGLEEIEYYGGYNKGISNKLFLENRSNGICLYDKANNLKILILKRNIINFSMVGDYNRDSIVSGGKLEGGDFSLWGSIKGKMLYGDIGELIYARKKYTNSPIKTEVNVTDTRKIILKFKENEEEKGMILDKSVWEHLCFLCPEKKIK